MNFFREEKFSMLPSENKVMDEKKLVQTGKEVKLTNI
jgi:hypothetical protein